MTVLVRILILVSLSLFTLNGFSQGQANNWYFGSNAGLTFNTNPPTALTNGALNTSEGCATLSNAAGNLLFYTDGITVYNRNHLAMPNGTGLLGNPSSAQSAIIIPKPGSTTNYYIVTVPEAGAVGMCFSEVDMSLSGGFGEVLPGNKNTLMFTPSSEKVTAVKHANNLYYWVIGRNNGTGRNYYAFLIDCNGINTTPIISNNVSSTNGENWGYLVASPDGSKLASASSGSGVEIVDFNTATGVVSNPINLGSYNFGGGANGAYGVAFSPNGNILYGTSIHTWEIAQWDLTAANIPATRTIVGSTNGSSATRPGYRGGALQLAPDGKIYTAEVGLAFLGVINNPNTLGAGCNFVPSQVNLAGRLSRLGLPPFIQSFFDTTSFGINHVNQCISDSIEFSVNGSPNLDSLRWFFGEPSSPQNTSNLQNPKHQYANPGNYTVMLIRYLDCIRDTVTKQITIFDNARSTQQVSLCAGGTYVRPNGGIASTQGTYIDTLQNASFRGCDSIVTTNITIMNAVVNAGNDQLICYGNTAQLNATGTNILNYTWDPDPTLSATNIPNPIASPLTTTTYTVRSRVRMGNNLVVNGDFSQGNTGFSSGYSYLTGTLSQGQYTITTNPTLHNSGFSSCGDHTTGSSNMLLADGACGTNGVPSNTLLWCQTITVTPNTDYAFSAWMANVLNAQASSTLLFTINGVPIGNPPSTAVAACQWAEFYVVWNSGSATTANICIAEGTGVCSGNDFAIDDISFYQICDAVDNVTVRVDRVLASFTDSTQVSCFGFNDGDATITPSSGITPFSYQWNNGQTSAVASNLTAGNYTVTIRDSANCSTTRSIIITQPPLLTNVITQTQNNLCFGDSLAAITNTPNGGTTPYTYSWNSGPTTQNINSLPAGFYRVEIRDANNCVRYDSLQITQPAIINHNLAITSPILCFGNTTNINTTVTGGTTPYNFLWSNNAVSQNLTNISAGSYFLQITDNNNCTAFDTIIVNEPPILSSTVAQTQPILCFGDLTGVNLTVNGGVLPYSYAWNNSANSQNLTNIGAGTYTVQITDNNNCILSDTITITEPTLLTHTFNVANALVCYGDQTDIIVTSSGGTAPYSYAWNTNATSANLTNVPAGFYRVEIKDANDCTILDSTTITQPNLITSTYNTIVCNSPSYSLPSGRIVTSSGIYIDTIPNFNGCDSIITLDLKLSNIIASIAPISNVTCFGFSDGSATLNVNGGILPYSYQWNNGQTSATASNLVAGNYAVIVRDSVDCRDTITTTITEPTELMANTTPPVAFCDGNATTITANASGGTTPYNVIWSNQNTNWSQSVQPSNTTTYTAVVTDNNGCVKSSSVTITVYPNPDADFSVSPEGIITFGTPISIKDNSTLADYRNWDMGDGTQYQSQTLFSHLYQEEGEYCVELEVSTVNNCTDAHTVCVEITPEYTVYIPNTFTPNDDKLNPAFRVVSRGFSNMNMSIFNRWGQELIRLEGDQPVIIGWDGNYNGSPAPQGIYTYKLEVIDLKNKKHTYLGNLNLIR